MSYDLMVFDPASAPRERAAFKEWYSQQTEWGEGHDYMDPSLTTPELRKWYQEIEKIYPNMNGDRELDDDEEDVAADYSIGKCCIYGAFSWSVASEVYSDVRRLAIDCKVGFYDVSGDMGDGEIYFPDTPSDELPSGQ